MNSLINLATAMEIAGTQPSITEVCHAEFKRTGIKPLAENVTGHAGETIHNAARLVLADIHAEIDAAIPAWQKTYDADQEAEEARHSEKAYVAEIVK